MYACMIVSDEAFQTVLYGVAENYTGQLVCIIRKFRAEPQPFNGFLVFRFNKTLLHFLCNRTQ